MKKTGHKSILVRFRLEEVYKVFLTFATAGASGQGTASDGSSAPDLTRVSTNSLPGRPA